MRIRRPRSKKLKRQLQLKPPGTAPETLVADPTAPKPRITAIGYGGTGDGSHEEHQVGSIDELRAFRSRHPRLWINVDGLGDAEAIRQLGELFGLHKLALEDVLSTRQRPKVDIFADHLFIVIREPMPVEGRFETDQVSIFLGENFVVTFQERQGDCLDPVRERIRGARGRTSVAGPDYLVYSIIDAVVDAYFPVLEAFGEKLEELEDRAVEHPSAAIVHEIHGTKRELLQIRRAIWPARESVGLLARGDSPLIHEETRVYMRDAYDHLVQLIDMLENYRELGSDLMDIYLSSQSHRLNEVMKVLTVIATIFMPLSFIVGIYGMNFETKHPLNMPELHWQYGYLFVWAIILLVGGGMLAWFFKRGWIGPGKWGSGKP